MSSDVVFNPQKAWGSLYILQMFDKVDRGPIFLNFVCIHQRVFS